MAASGQRSVRPDRPADRVPRSGAHRTLARRHRTPGLYAGQGVSGRIRSGSEAVRIRGQGQSGQPLLPRTGRYRRPLQVHRPLYSLQTRCADERLPVGYAGQYLLGRNLSGRPLPERGMSDDLRTALRGAIFRPRGRSVRDRQPHGRSGLRGGDKAVEERDEPLPAGHRGSGIFSQGAAPDPDAPLRKIAGRRL